MKQEIDNPEHSSVVRAKASQRKGRTGEINRVARVPTQERSRARYQAIISATEEILQTSHIEDISLYDIAKKANIAPASVHYLFSTITAVHIELHRLYNDKLTEAVLENQRRIAKTQNPNWQEWLRFTMEEARNRLNGDRAMSEIMLGPTLHRQIRKTNRLTNMAIGQVSLDVLRTYFLVPEIPNFERYFLYSTEITDAIWSGAYSLHGHIDDESFTESVRASLAYLRCFLPETLHLKPELARPRSPDMPVDSSANSR